MGKAGSITNGKEVAIIPSPKTAHSLQESEGRSEDSGSYLVYLFELESKNWENIPKVIRGPTWLTTK